MHQNLERNIDKFNIPKTAKTLMKKVTLGNFENVLMSTSLAKSHSKEDLSLAEESLKVMLSRNKSQMYPSSTIVQEKDESIYTQTSEERIESSDSSFHPLDNQEEVKVGFF